MTTERQPGDAIEAAADSFTAGELPHWEDYSRRYTFGEVGTAQRDQYDKVCAERDRQAERIAQLERERDEALYLLRGMHVRHTKPPRGEWSFENPPPLVTPCLQGCPKCEWERKVKALTG